MPSFGEKLRLEREKRKITLDQISSSTKIGTRMLQALEEDRFSQLPGGIFNKGFVRAYARVVGLDEDQTVADYLEASGDAPPFSPEVVGREPARNSEDAIRIREEEDSGRLEIRAEAASRQLPWGVFAVILLIVALALSLWNHRRREREQSLRRLPEKTAVQPSAAPPAQQRGPGSISNVPASIGSPIPSSPGSSQINSRAASTAMVTSNQKPPLPAQSSQGAPGLTPAPGEFTLVIQAREESWLSITVDGKSAGSATLAAGDTRALHGRKEIVVRAGNVGGLNFLLNGKKLDIAGDFGEVKTITVGPAGLLPEAEARPVPQP